MLRLHTGDNIPSMSTDRQVLNTATFFGARRVFSLKEFARALELPAKTAFERVKYHQGRGSLIKLERGLYAAVPQGVAPGEFIPDRYLVALAARPDCIFSHHAALELLGAAHSDWSVCTLFTGRRRAELELKGAEIRFLAHPSVLLRKGLEDIATRKVERLGRLLRVTSPERTLVDGFRQPKFVGGLSELVESAAGFGVLDLELLRETLEAYDQKALWAAVGWFLERYQSTFYVPPEYLALLESRRPLSPHYLPRSERSGKHVRRWNLVLPANLLYGDDPNETE